MHSNEVMSPMEKPSTHSPKKHRRVPRQSLPAPHSAERASAWPDHPILGCSREEAVPRFLAGQTGQFQAGRGIDGGRGKHLSHQGTRTQGTRGEEVGALSLGAPALGRHFPPAPRVQSRSTGHGTRMQMSRQRAQAHSQFSGNTEGRWTPDPGPQLLDPLASRPQSPPGRSM